jgi:SAM-dependent methyltransferase
MKLERWRRYWDGRARTDPLWAILSYPDKSGGRWNVEDFFATGVAEIGNVMRAAERLGLPKSRKTALDFGCGIGRLTQPLADHFEQVHGLDVSPAMLDLAAQHNRKGDRCRYHWNPEPALRGFTDRSADLIYSKITLQHIPPRHVRRYLIEFMRVLADGGLLIFQLPGKPLCGRVVSVFRSLYSSLQLPWPTYMNGISPKQVVVLLENCGGRVLEVQGNRDAGPGFESFEYLLTRA